ncbi:MAG TPA: zf-HC2 domain-containing protein [Longimicrobium sp.]|nr:zf-HC2 domain-containing protein [Longimicrobium sp.]
MIDCGSFLEGYSDYRDGLLPRAEREAFAAHLRVCASCARYDRAVARGAGVLRELPELEVSDDFGARLQHRLFHLEDEMAVRRRRRVRMPRYAVTAAAAAVAAVAFVPLAQRATPGVMTMLPSVAVQAPRPDPAHLASSEGYAARLEEVGVDVYPTPYREVLYRGGAVATLAGYEPGVLRHSASQ